MTQPRKEWYGERFQPRVTVMCARKLRNNEMVLLD
jgi:hypothetical protein